MKYERNVLKLQTASSRHPVYNQNLVVHAETQIFLIFFLGIKEDI